MARVFDIAAFFKGRSLTGKFRLGFGLLLLLILLVAVTGYLSLKLVSDAEKSILRSTEIQRFILEMDHGMEKARRLHADFFLHYPEIGLSQAHEQYAQPSVRESAQVIRLSRKLRDLLNSPETGAAFRSSHVNLNLYLSSAQRFADTSIQAVELVTERAAPKSGLEARLQSTFSKLRRQSKPHEKLDHLVDHIRSYTQEYKVIRQRHLMQSAFNLIFDFRKELALASVPEENHKEAISTILNSIEETGERLLQVDAMIKAHFHDFALQAQTVTPVSATLIELARTEVLQARQRITDTYRLASIIIAFIALSGLLTASLVARVLGRNITRRVISLTDSTEEVRQGRLDVVAEESGDDELGRLGRNFNLMTARIKELVERLEEKVDQRTTELSASEKRYRHLFENLRSGVAVYAAVDNGQDFIFKDINRAVEVIENVQRQEVLGRKVTEVFPGVIEFGLFKIFQEVWQSGQSAHHPIHLYSDGRLQGWRENFVYKLSSGEIVTVYDDLTTQKQAEAEKQQMEASLQRAKKMEAIGLMAGGVAHDLNNILAGIVGFPELILEELPKESKLYSPIQAIYDAGLRAAAVVADLLTVARGVASVKQPASLNTLVREYLDSPEYRKLASFHPAIDCQTLLRPDLHVISCSPVHIKKCLMNLVTNAMEAVDDAGMVNISTLNRCLDEEAALHSGLQAGEYAQLTIQDTGSGIPAHELEHIFEPFYTKKMMGRSGTGLGLAVVWNCIQDHGGSTLVESDTNGTSFHLLFPASKEQLSQQDEEIDQESIMGQGEKILVVDDERHLRELAVRFLEKFGYQAISVSSGEKAVEYMQGNRVDLVLLDMIMDPGINGRQTYEQILAIHPEQKALIASGFSKNNEVTRTLALGACDFLKKPYTKVQLGRSVKEALQQTA